MIWINNKVVWVVATVLLATKVWGITDEATSDDRNYRVIVERNPFSIKPPPPPPTNTPVADKPKDEILLTGITSIGLLRAYFQTQPKPAQGGKPGEKTTEYYCLGVDDKKDGLEVLSIDPVTKSVRVRNSGVESTMTFASNGVK